MMCYSDLMRDYDVLMYDNRSDPKINFVSMLCQ
jgi:hypothetical protein